MSQHGRSLSVSEVLKEHDKLVNGANAASEAAQKLSEELDPVGAAKVKVKAMKTEAKAERARLKAERKTKKGKKLKKKKGGDPMFDVNLKRQKRELDKEVARIKGEAKAKAKELKQKQKLEKAQEKEGGGDDSAVGAGESAAAAGPGSAGAAAAAAPAHAAAEHDHAKPTGGYLKQKSSRVVFGKHVWDERFFVVVPDRGEVAIFKDHRNVIVPIEVIKLDEVTGVELLAKKNVTRFDILMAGDRMVSLLAKTPREAETWVRALTEARIEVLNERIRQQAPQRPVAAAVVAATVAPIKTVLNAVVNVATMVIPDVLLPTPQPKNDDAATQSAKDDDGLRVLVEGNLIRLNAPPLIKKSKDKKKKKEATKGGGGDAAAGGGAQSGKEDGAVELDERPFAFVFARLVNHTLSFYTDRRRGAPVGFIDTSSLKSVESIPVGVAPGAGASQTSDLKPRGVRLTLKDGAVWDLAVPTSEELEAEAWESALLRAHAKSVQALGDGARAGGPILLPPSTAVQDAASSEERRRRQRGWCLCLRPPRTR